MILIPTVCSNFLVMFLCEILNGYIFPVMSQTDDNYSDGNILTLLCPEIIKNKYMHFHYSEA